MSDYGAVYTEAQGLNIEREGAVQAYMFGALLVSDNRDQKCIGYVTSALIVRTLNGFMHPSEAVPQVLPPQSMKRV